MRGCLAIASLALIGAQCQLNHEPMIVTGNWGGDHIGLIATADSVAIDYDCASGSIPNPIVAARTGQFAALGKHVISHGGPVRIGEIPESHAARYDGVVRGSRMELVVTILDRPDSAGFFRPDTVGRFTLERGATPRIVRCL